MAVLPQKAGIHILNKSNIKHKPISNNIFYFLPYEEDTTIHDYIATIRGSIRMGSPLGNNFSFWYLFSLRDRIAQRAYHLGANSFRIRKFELDSNSNIMSLTLDVYYTRGSLNDAGSISKYSNEIFIFPPDCFEGKSQIRINSLNIELKSREYFIYNVKPKENVLIGGGRHMSRLTIYCDSIIPPKYIIFQTGNVLYSNPIGLGMSPVNFPIITEGDAKFLISTYYIHAKSGSDSELNN
jgi:hypothetical protein